MLLDNKNIAALATPSGNSAISIIRVTGKDSIFIVNKIFKSVKKGKNLNKQPTHTIHLGYITEQEKIKNKYIIDKVLVSIFREPFSYTGENMVEISCHGSYYIQRKVLQLLIKKGVRLANPGEFTFRAFMNKKLDLIQAEAIQRLILSSTKSCSNICLEQINGSVTKEIEKLKKMLVDFSSLLEIELDFSEENFIAYNNDKKKLFSLLKNIKNKIEELVNSFSLGNAIKKGVNIAIIGDTNVGKSTLFNSIIKDERSIVSSTKGTTRNFIEEYVNIGGILFRFLDTAGIHNTENVLEKIGIKKTLEKVKESHIIFYVFDASSKKNEQKKILSNIRFFYHKYPYKDFFIIVNKSDIFSFKDFCDFRSNFPYFFIISAKKNIGIVNILNTLKKLFLRKLKNKKTIIIETRHYESLKNSLKEISKAFNLLKKNKTSEELISMHIKEVLNYLKNITGEVTNEDILKNIFSKFCIGK